MTTPNATAKYMIAAGHLRGLNTAPRPPIRINDVEVIDIDADDDCDNTPAEPTDHAVIPMAPGSDNDCNDDAKDYETVIKDGKQWRRYTVKMLIDPAGRCGCGGEAAWIGAGDRACLHTGRMISKGSRTCRNGIEVLDPKEALAVFDADPEISAPIPYGPGPEICAIPYRITPEALGLSDRARVVIRHPARLAADQLVPMRRPVITKKTAR